MKYRSLKYGIIIGSNVYSRGDIIEHFDGYPWEQAIRNGAIEIADGDSVPTKKIVETEPKIVQSKTKTATITRGGPWYKVMDERGEIIGKPTRNEDEANKIKKEYESS